MTAVVWLATHLQRWRGEDGDRVLTGDEATVGAALPVASRPAPVTGRAARARRPPDQGLTSEPGGARPAPHAA